MNDAKLFYYSEIISYMENAVVKSYEIINTSTNVDDRYFDIEIRNKKYPSCYQYNILVMLAKRLIREEESKVNVCKNNLELHKKLAQRIVAN